MAFEINGKYLAYISIRPQDVGYNDDIQRIYDVCKELSELHGTPLSEFHLSTENSYGSTSWEITAMRNATPEEIEEVKAEKRRRANLRRQEYERLKKEFER